MRTTKDLSADRQGFTLIECLIVVAIMTTVAAGGLLLSMDSYRGYSFRNDRDSLISLLQHARAQAIGNVCLGDVCMAGADHGVAIKTDRYVLFQGSSYATRDVEQDIVVPSSPNSDKVGLEEVVFSALSGDPLQTGEISLMDVSVQGSIITIGDEGQITWTH